ncbi:MAG: hemoglobin [Gammaproteobacteria bacterium]|jgi:hemoglobin
MTLSPRFAVTAPQIAQVVSIFYQRVRQHPKLGPIFCAHVIDWPAHEQKITSFWRNAILMERTYSGNPMQAHLNAGNVRSDDFADWLAEFDVVLTEVLPEVPAQAWSALAHRIGQGLRFGLDAHDPCNGRTDIPRL